MTRRPAARAAFTLIELLVVIAIIAILISLIGPAVQKARGGGPRLLAKNDISQIDEACTTFKTKFGFYPPTQFRIPVNVNDADFQVLKRMFPRYTGTPNGTGVITPALSGANTPLTGNASVVYFLAGPAGTGWAIDAPIAPSAGAAAKNMFLDFPDRKRLVGTLPGAVYNDPWGTPYIYHGSITGGNYPNIGVPGPGATTGVFPFNRGAGRWEVPTGVQVISAGENKLFGQGGTWAPAGGQYATGQNGGDDIANFNAGKPLGVN